MDRWHSGPQPRCDSRPAAGVSKEAGKAAVEAGRLRALRELGEERGGDGGGSRIEGGRRSPFLFSDPGASGTQSPELGGTRRLLGPG